MAYDPTADAQPFTMASAAAKCYTNSPVRTARRLVQNVGRQIQAVDEASAKNPKVTPVVTAMVKHPK